MTETQPLPHPRFAQSVFWAALILTFATLIMGPLHRFGVIEFGLARNVLMFAAFAGPVLAVISLIAAFRARPGRAISLLGFIMSTGVAAVIWSIALTAMTLPRIHDISTDTDNPPAFEAVLAERKPTDNDAAYGGDAIASQQKAAYPDIAPVKLDLDANTAYDHALKAAETLGWTLIASDRPQGRIEATDRTLWFGFRDDIIIRITPREEGSVLDLRSASRIGVSDIGANAKRIRRFISTFNKMR